jgi:uncharacterized protein with beta-barrel porin domain
LITDNNTIITLQNVRNEGIIERFFTFDAKQSLTNYRGGIFSIAQEAVLNAKYTVENLNGAHLFVFGDMTANKVTNEGTIYGTGSIILTSQNSTLFNNNNGQISPGGSVVDLPYSDAENTYRKAYGTSTIGSLTIYGTLENSPKGIFNITVNPQPDGNPVIDEFDLTTMRLLNTTKSANTYGRTDGGIGANDIIFVRAVRNYNGNDGIGYGSDILYGGNAIIKGGIVQVEARGNIPGTIDPARYVSGTKLPIIVTESGLTVNEELKMELPNGGREIALFDFNLGYNDYTYWLEIGRRYKYGNNKIKGQTYNQSSVGRYLDLVGSDPNPESEFFLALMALDNLSDVANPNNIRANSPDLRTISPSAQFALDQMSGAIYATMETASFQNVSTIISQLADYLRSDPLLTYCRDCRVYEPAKFDIWSSTYGTLGGSDHDGNAYGYDQSTGGTIIGFDRLYVNRMRAGIFGTFGSSTYKTDLRERSKATDLSVGFYARREMSRGYLLGTLGFGYTDYNTTRQLSFVGRNAKSDRNAYLWSAHIERALDLGTIIGRFQPYIGAQYIGNQFDNFNETGAGSLSLQGSSSDAHSLRSILGARFTRHPRMVRGGKFEAFFNLDWKIELLRYNKGNLTAQFTNPNYANFNGTGNFHVYGNRQNRNWINTGMGANWDRNNTRLTLGYNIGINGNGFFLHTGNVALVYSR